MTDILAVYRGPLKNRHGLIRGGEYLLKTQKNVQLGLGVFTVIPHTIEIDGKAVSGPIHYWNTIDFGLNWAPMEVYNDTNS